MVQSCGLNLAKILLIIFNVFFFFCGAALLGIGIWMIVDPSIANFLDILAVPDGSGTMIQYAAYLLIAVGAVIILISFFGCCGAATESACMLGVYIFFLAILLIAQLAGGILAAVYKNDIKKKSHEYFVEIVEKYYKTDGSLIDDDNARAFNQSLTNIQADFACCGFEDYKDFKNVMADSDAQVPWSCCKLNVDPDEVEVTIADVIALDGCENEFNSGSPTFTNLFEKGCKDAVLDWVDEKSTILIGVGIGLCVAELLGFLFAICLCCAVRKEG